MRRTGYVIRLTITLAVLALPAAALGYTGEEPPYGTQPKLPHLYANGSMVGELQAKRIVGWGIVTFATSLVGEVQCRTVFTAELANPLATRKIEGKEESYVGPGKGHWFIWTPWQCTGPETSMEIKNLETEPPNAELVEPQGGPARLALRGLSVSIRRVTLNSTGSGELQPNVRNVGISIGSAPEELGFARSAGELSGGMYASNGNLKFEGFAGQELTTVKSS